jgi:hypothetical protein
MVNAVIHSIRERENFGLRIAELQITEKDKAMNEPEKQQSADAEERTGDSANNEVGPTEKLRESDKSEGELSVPGAQNPASKEIKDETGPNSE